jgi:hypothetical protein
LPPNIKRAKRDTGFSFYTKKLVLKERGEDILWAFCNVLSSSPSFCITKFGGGGYLLSTETLKGKHVLHCNENPIYVFPEKELRSLNSNSHIYVSVSDLYVLRIGPHIFL